MFNNYNWVRSQPSLHARFFFWGVDSAVEWIKKCSFILVFLKNGFVYWWLVLSIIDFYLEEQGKRADFFWGRRQCEAFRLDFPGLFRPKLFRTVLIGAFEFFLAQLSLWYWPEICYLLLVEMHKFGYLSGSGSGPNRFRFVWRQQNLGRIRPGSKPVPGRVLPQKN